jgi:hypothetical protein
MPALADVRQPHALALGYRRLLRLRPSRELHTAALVRDEPDVLNRATIRFPELLDATLNRHRRTVHRPNLGDVDHSPRLCEFRVFHREARVQNILAVRDPLCQSPRDTRPVRAALDPLADPRRLLVHRCEVVL